MVIWAEKYIKQDFTRVIWSDDTRVSLEGPDNWSSDWVIIKSQSETRVKRQQWGGGIMVWGAMCGETLIGPFSVQINHYTYTLLPAPGGLFYTLAGITTTKVKKEACIYAG